MLERQEFSFWTWSLLNLVAYGIYHIFYQYKMGSALLDMQKNRNKPVFENLPLVSVIVTIIGLSLVVDCIHQSEINKLIS